MARRKKTGWLWLIGLPLIIGVSAHWGLYFYTQYKLDDFVVKMSPKAAITYGDLVTDLRGRIEVGNVMITPVGQTEKIRIDRLLLTGPDAWGLIRQYNPVNGVKGPPFSLRLQMVNLHIPLTPKMTLLLNEWSNPSDSSVPSSVGMCEEGGYLSFADLYRLGFKEIQVDGSAGYRFDPEQRLLIAALVIDVKSMWHLKLDVALDGIENLGSELGWMAARMKGVTLSNNIHPSLGKAISRFCADKSGLTLPAFEQNAAERFIENLEQQGISLGWDLKEVVRDYYINWGTIEIKVAPQKPVGLLALPSMQPEQLKKMLGLSLRINNRLVKDVDIHVDSNLVEKTATKPEKFAPAETEVKKPKVHYSWMLKEASIGALPAYLDHQVRVKTKTGVIHRGVLVSVDDQRISVQKTVSGGKFIAHLPKNEIVWVRVRVRVKVENK